MRISPDGTLDPTFNVGAGVRFGPVAGSVHCIVLQADGKVLISGTFDKYNGTSIRDLARLNPDGSLDNSFNPGTNNTTVIRDIELLPDGRILIAGPFTTIAGSPMAGIARLHPDGSLDTSFNIGTGCIGVAGIDVGGGTVHATSPTIDLGHLPSGMYQLRAGNSGSVRVIKQ